MENSSFKEKIMLILIGAAALAGIFLRFNGWSQRSLEYDEVWTFLNYSGIPVSKIFTDLSTPNNHPLNTLFIQWCIDKNNFYFYQLRLPVLLFGIATILLTVLLTWKAVKRKDSVLFATACISFNGYLVHYSQTARGYSIQTFFVLLAAAALFWLSRHKNSLLYGLLFIFAAVCCCLTITSGLIFICALCGAYLFAVFRKTSFKTLIQENCVFLGAALVFCLFAGLWYGLNYNSISAGQSFGTSVVHPWAFLKFISEMLTKLILWPFVIIHIAVLFIKKHPRKKISLFALTFMGLTFLSALVVKAGFDRVYLPLFPIAAISAAVVIPDLLYHFRKEKLTTPLLLLFSVLTIFPMNYSRKSQMKPDYIPLMKEIMQDIEPDIFVNFTVHDTYPLRFNYPESVQDYLTRLGTPALKGFLQVNSKGNISAYNPQTGSAVHITPPSAPIQSMQSQTGTDIELFALEPLTPRTDPKGKILLVTMSPHPHDMFLRYFQPMVSAEQWCMANTFLTTQLYSPEGKPLKSGAYICPEAKQTAEYYLNISHATGLNWRFYIVK